MTPEYGKIHFLIFRLDTRKSSVLELNIDSFRSVSLAIRVSNLNIKKWIFQFSGVIFYHIFEFLAKNYPQGVKNNRIPGPTSKIRKIRYFRPLTSYDPVLRGSPVRNPKNRLFQRSDRKTIITSVLSGPELAPGGLFIPTCTTKKSIFHRSGRSGFHGPFGGGNDQPLFDFRQKMSPKHRKIGFFAGKSRPRPSKNVFPTCFWP